MPADPNANDPGAGGPVVAIDGPAGAGKSTVSRAVAEALGVTHLDTGAMYRAATLACLRAGVAPDDPVACARVVVAADISWRDERAWLDGEDVETEIRGEAVTAAVSAVSAHAKVREALVPSQRAAVGAGGVVEGRDIGTVVLPEADLKVFLTASPEERARRRAEQLGHGEHDLEALAEAIRARDQADAGRAVSPLIQAEDAWVLDTTDLAFEEVVGEIVARAWSAAGAVADAVPADAVPADAAQDPVRGHRALPRVAVVGRPNVGKSTLVNRILGARVTIVEERPGVTRDRTEHLAAWTGTPFVVIDTGGWEHGAQGMAARIVAQAEAAIETADLVLLVVDATVGVLDDDERYARQLRRGGVPVLVVANKVDGERQEPLAHELYRLGLGTPHAVSARHGRGVGDLLDEVVAGLPVGEVAVPDTSQVPRVALVGRPNVGKSSLFNRLAGEERSIVDAVAHTTRDAVDTMVELDGEPWVFVDTAGLRRRYRHGEDTELYSVDRTRAAIAQSDLVLFILDASEPLGEQDQRLAAELRDAGCGVVLVLNKWDALDGDRRVDLERELDRLLAFAAWAPRINVSALTGRGLRRVLAALRLVRDNHRRRITTHELNRLVADAVERHPLPRQGQRHLKIRYATQVGTAPPHIVVFANGRLPDAYRRYLERELRAAHDFTGVPLRIDDRPPAPRRRR